METPRSNGKVDSRNVNWIPMLGLWEIEEDRQVFLGEGLPATANGQTFPIGLAVSDTTLESGRCQVLIRFTKPFGAVNQAGGIVLGYKSPQQHYVFAELGAARSAFSVGEFVAGSGWRPLIATGMLENLREDREYRLEVLLRGQEFRIIVDGVPLIQYLLSKPLEGRQVGLIAAGPNRISFSHFFAESGRPRAFVAMEFGEPFDTFYNEVIYKQADAAGFEVVRIDEKAGPGVIFQDIQREIEQAGTVIAEITPANPNVFYELGYAHALGKPTILLAQRGSQLPFDIRSYRVVFYNDTIGGKPEVERNLRKHLDAVKGFWTGLGA
jgi:hypothetical protein